GGNPKVAPASSARPTFEEWWKQDGGLGRGPACKDIASVAWNAGVNYALSATRRSILEECAKVCDVIATATQNGPTHADYMKWDDHTAAELARRIRAKAEQAAKHE